MLFLNYISGIMELSFPADWPFIIFLKKECLYNTLGASLLCSCRPFMSCVAMNKDFLCSKLKVLPGDTSSEMMFNSILYRKDFLINIHQSVRWEQAQEY